MRLSVLPPTVLPPNLHGLFALPNALPHGANDGLAELWRAIMTAMERQRLAQCGDLAGGLAPNDAINYLSSDTRLTRTASSPGQRAGEGF